MTWLHLQARLGPVSSAPATLTHLPPGVEHARSYARLGLRPIWLHPPTDTGIPEQQRGKKPLDLEWQSGAWVHPDVVTPPRLPGANIGLVTGRVAGAPHDRAVVVVDADDPTADAWVTTNLPPTPWVAKTRNGHHYYYQRPAVDELRRFKVVTDKANNLGKIDVQADGGQVVAPPSVHRTGHVYAATQRWTVTDFESMPVFNPAWFAQVRKRESTRDAPPAVSGNRNNSLTSIAGRLRRAGAGETAILLELQAANNKMAMPLDDVEVETIARSVARYDPADWMDGLARNDKGRIKPTVANTIAILGNDPRWAQVLRWDEFSHGLVFCGTPPFDGLLSDPRDGDVTALRQLTDVDISRIAAWISNAPDYDRMEPPKNITYEAARVVGQRHRFHQVAEYLRCLPAWDKKPRISTWLTAYAGVGDSEYARMVGRWWLIGAVARALKPGCKMDTVLILEGPQGVKKSTLIRTLVPKTEWFLDSELDLGSQQAMDRLRGKWIAELGELASMKRGDVDRTKAFLSSSSDTFRVSYDRLSNDFPRTCVMMGSTNPSGPYIVDITGGRRYWPVVCSGTLDVDALGLARDQIWAEALAAFDAGERWWADTPEERDALLVEQSKRVAGDTWEDKVTAYVDGKDSVTLGNLLDALGVETHRQTRGDQMRAAALMAHIGWDRRKVRGVWQYVRPAV